MKRATWLGLAALLTASNAVAQQLHPIPNSPGSTLVWRAKPSADDMATYYPPKARRAERGGWAVIECQTLATGDMKDCLVLGESPKDFGFGDAALKLSAKFKLDPAKNDPATLAGGVVAIPILMLTPSDSAVPPRDYLAGEPSVLLTTTPKGSAPCPTTDSPGQGCSVHRFSWVQRPSLPETADLVRRAAATPERTTVLCPIAADMKLRGCSPNGPADPTQVEAVSGLIPLFTAPTQAEDKTPTKDGFVVVQFNWPALKHAVETSVLTRR